jgi:hypothetical protein
MKKGIGVILLALYLAFSCGIVINMNYCMNRFDSSKPGAAKNELCRKRGMHTTGSKGCCHHVLKVIKIQDDQQASAGIFKFNSREINVGQVSLYVPDLINEDINVLSPSHRSPPLSKQDTYLVNCVFRI